MSKFSLSKLNKNQKKLRSRILELSFASNFSHLGSCLTSLDLIDVVYKIKNKNDKFILSNGHAGIAWYVVLEKYGYFKNPKTINKLNIHPDRNIKHGINVSTGSLGQGLPIAVGMAIAEPKNNIYCMLSDGECTEGSIWEALRVAKEMKTYNLKIIINANGWSGYDKVDIPYLIKRIKAFGFEVNQIDGHNPNLIEKTLNKKNKKKLTCIFANTSVEQFTFLNGVDAHYYTMTKDNYEAAIKSLI